MVRAAAHAQDPANACHSTTCSTSTGSSDWVVLAPFLSDREPTWLEPFVPDRHELRPVWRRTDEESWHAKPKKASLSRSEWFAMVGLVVKGLRQRRHGVITVFPHLAVLMATAKRVTRGKWPLVCYFFTMEDMVGPRLRFARWALKSADAFIVHSTLEIPLYSSTLGLPRRRLHFIPLQKPDLHRDDLPTAEDTNLIFATGSGYRDYATMFKAVQGLDCRVLVVPGRHAVDGLVPPNNVTIDCDMALNQIRENSQRAAVNVIPMTTDGSLAGTVTIVEALRLGCALVATDRSGVGDYITNGENGLLVPPGDADALRAAIVRVLEEPDTRKRLSEAARRTGHEHLSDEAAGAALGEVLDQFL